MGNSQLHFKYQTKYFVHIVNRFCLIFYSYRHKKILNYLIFVLNCELIYIFTIQYKICDIPSHYLFTRKHTRLHYHKNVNINILRKNQGETYHNIKNDLMNLVESLNMYNFLSSCPRKIYYVIKYKKTTTLERLKCNFVLTNEYTLKKLSKTADKKYGTFHTSLFIIWSETLLYLLFLI